MEIYPFWNETVSINHKKRVRNSHRFFCHRKSLLDYYFMNLVKIFMRTCKLKVTTSILSFHGKREAICRHLKLNERVYWVNKWKLSWKIPRSYSIFCRRTNWKTESIDISECSVFQKKLVIFKVSCLLNFSSCHWIIFFKDCFKVICHIFCLLWKFQVD